VIIADIHAAIRNGSAVSFADFEGTERTGVPLRFYRSGETGAVIELRTDTGIEHALVAWELA
jgi:hypothetical protein